MISFSVEPCITGPPSCNVSSDRMTCVIYQRGQPGPWERRPQSLREFILQSPPTLVSPCQEACVLCLPGPYCKSCSPVNPPSPGPGDSGAKLVIVPSLGTDIPHPSAASPTEGVPVSLQGACACSQPLPCFNRPWVPLPWSRSESPKNLAEWLPSGRGASLVLFILEPF